ncbi:MAG: DNA polymerase III subunit alpha [Candidatus Gracilibacteria bacterium]|nr:DNA polymerase III subunit alpha [Candidatus Gracilibacteria bacterium]
MFVHLHNHTHYSILNGLPKPKAYIKKAKELGMEAVAITDTANIHGGHEFYEICHEEGIKAILGCEFYVVSKGISDVSRDNIPHSLVLLAKNLDGYKNIIDLVTLSNLEGFKDVPRIDTDMLKKHSENLICLSGNHTSELAYFILSGKSDEEIVDRIRFYQDIFGAENYYLELIYHEDIPRQRMITDRLIDLAKTYSIPVVATNNCYYIDKSDKTTQDVIQALGTGHEMENPDRPTLINGDYSFLSESEMEMLFGHIPESLYNTKKIADMVSITIPRGGVLIPRYELPENDQVIYKKALELEKNEIGIQKLEMSEWYLRYLCFLGLNKRYDFDLSEDEIFEFIKKIEGPHLAGKLQDTGVEELQTLALKFFTDKKIEKIKTLNEDFKSKLERLEYELLVVHEMGFDGYFLIVADYINWAKDNDIPVGPGRGSAAGALLAYLSGITDIDPLPYELLFERFLNPARVSMPDIDTDFADDARDKVIDYCRRKYGADHVAQICTFGTFAARAAVKDVGRVRGIGFQEMNELAKLIPEKPGTKLKGALEESIEFKEAYDNNPKYKEIIDDALKIEGNVRQIGVHACAVIIAPEPMTNFTALQYPPKNNDSIITQYSAHPLEDLGLLKMDFLGLRNLTIIKRTREIVKAKKDIDIDLSKINMEDQKVFEIFAKGDTTGVFQFESDGMRKYLIDLQPNTFEDIIAMVALYRPGPIAFIPNYVDRKQGREAIEYMYDELARDLTKKYGKDIIEIERTKLFEDLGFFMNVTYGIAVYQEQLMRLVQSMAGFTLAEADMLRRGVGKKKKDVIEAIRIEFIKKAGEFRNYKPETANYIYDKMIMPAADYSFNKSHAACYALIAYHTAYLKAYFPTEFLTAMMTSDEENMERIVLEVSESKSKGIDVLAPSVQASLKHFTYIDDNNIRFGLKAIKGLGDGPIDAILDARKEGGKFSNLEDFIKRVGKDVVNKKSLESLILSGSMDEFGPRGQLFANIENITRFSKADTKKTESSQIGMFDFSGDTDSDALKLEEASDFGFEDRLKREKDVLGFRVSGHPLDGLQKYIAKRTKNDKYLKMSFEELENETIKSRESIQAVGVIKEIRRTITKNGKKMIFLAVESFNYDFEITIFDKDHDKYKDKVKEDMVVIVDGYLSINQEYKRKNIQVKDMKIVGLSMIREQAMDLQVFDDVKYIGKVFVAEQPSPPAPLPKARGEELEDDLERDDVKDDEENLEVCGDFCEVTDSLEEEQAKELEVQEEEKIDKYIVSIPTSASKQDLLDLKDFLADEYKGDISIFIELRGQEIDTKFSIENLDKLKIWEKERFL